MGLKLTLTRNDGSVARVVVSADSEATVGDVADYLYGADPTRDGTAPPLDATLIVTGLSQGADAAPRVAPRGGVFAASGIRSGDHIDLGATRCEDDEAYGPVAATVTITAGADKGKVVGLRAGSHTIGRDDEAAVSLTDPMVSARHARLVVGETLEIVDLGSTEGVLIDGAFVTRATLAAGDRVTLGLTEFTIARSAPVHRDVPSTQTHAFTRSPRVVPLLRPSEIALPSLPLLPTPRPFPRTALLAPVMLGLAMYLMTGRALSLVFVALSPLMMVGGFLDNRHHQRAQSLARAAGFEEALAIAERQLKEAHRRERETRIARSPSVLDVCAAVRAVAPPLWTHRPEHEAFLEVRLGLGTVPSVLALEAPAVTGAVDGTWEKVARLQETYASIGGVPVVANLRAVGGLGVAGPAPVARALSRAVVMQLAGLHSPMECVLAAFISVEAVTDWEWIEWLPHMSSPCSPLTGDHGAATRASCQRLLMSLEHVVSERAGGDIATLVAAPRGAVAGEGHSFAPDAARPSLGSAPLLPAIVVVVEDEAPVDRGRLMRLAEKGPDVNVHVLWIAGEASRLPAACRAYVAAPTSGDGRSGIVGQVRRGGFDEAVECESLSVADATDAARRMSCIEDVGMVTDDASDVPATLSFLEAHGVGALDPAHHAARWLAQCAAEPGAGRPFSLRALVGHAGAEPCYLDLTSHGPHALVGGTTGAGKSEFLQAWVLGMASAYGPHRVNFLLVDYKGGAAFAECVGLPHCVGYVTDLTPQLVARALASLRAELHHRERLLSGKAAKDLETLAARGDTDAPPSLVIVIDEFAALTREVPDFVDGMVDIAQRGRSLGLHLILATQRPAGVINDNLRANTNLRIALRMADEADSADILGNPAAAHLDPHTPGRAIARTGPGRLTTFQSAYAGAHSTRDGATVTIAVRDLALSSLGAWREVGGRDDEGAAPAAHETDVARVVKALVGAARLVGLPPPRRPWLDPLCERYDVDPMARAAAEGIAFGMIDDPSHQVQFTATYDPDKDGNLLVLGGAGAGKSTALRTLAVAAILSPSMGPVHIYGVDAAGGGLDMLRALPSVADVVESDDVERVGRMMTRLVEVVRERSRSFTAARASSLDTFRQTSGQAKVPRIALLIDGYGSFQSEYMNEPGRSQMFLHFKEVLTLGRSVGVTVVVAADRLAALHTSIQALMSRTVVLRLNDDAHYGVLGLRATGLTAQSPPGRGIDLASRKELQVAVLSGSSRIDEQARAVEALAASFTLLLGEPYRAAPIVRMPLMVSPRELPDRVQGLPVLGIDGTTLRPRTFDLERSFIIAGQAGTGRTSALAWMAAAIHRSHPDRPLVHVSQRRTTIGAVVPWTASYSGQCAGEEMLEAWREALEAEGQGPKQVILFLENVQDFGASVTDVALVQAVRRARRGGHLVIGEADTQGWMNGPLAGELRGTRRGLLLAPETGDSQMLFAVASGRMSRADAPPGRGVWVDRGVVSTVQIPWVLSELSTDPAAEARRGPAPE